MACAYDGLSTINICDGAGISARTSLDERLTLSYPPALARKTLDLGRGENHGQSSESTDDRSSFSQAPLRPPGRDPIWA